MSDRTSLPVCDADSHLMEPPNWLEDYADTKLTENCAGLFRERFLAKAFFKREPDQSVIDDVLQKPYA